MRQSLPQPRRSFQGRSPLLRGPRRRQLGAGIPPACGEEVLGREARSRAAGTDPRPLNPQLSLPGDGGRSRRPACRDHTRRRWADSPGQDGTRAGWGSGSRLLSVSTQHILTGAQVLFRSLLNCKLGVSNSTVSCNQRPFINYPLGTCCLSRALCRIHTSFPPAPDQPAHNRAALRRA